MNTKNHYGYFAIIIMLLMHINLHASPITKSAKKSTKELNSIFIEAGYTKTSIDSLYTKLLYFTVHNNDSLLEEHNQLIFDFLINTNFIVDNKTNYNQFKEVLEKGSPKNKSDHPFKPIIDNLVNESNVKLDSESIDEKNFPKKIFPIDYNNKHADKLMVKFRFMIDYCNQFQSAKLLEEKIKAEKDAQSNSTSQEFFIVEEMPQYSGEIPFEEALKCPHPETDYPLQGKVFVSAMISSLGEITEVKAIRGLSPKYDNAAIEKVKSIKDWTPGKQRGKAVDAPIVLIVKFE